MTQLHAHALAALPEISAAALPRDIQVFPPGNSVEFTLQDHPGEVFTMAVDAGVAVRAQADLQRMLSAETAGQGSAPFGGDQRKVWRIPKIAYDRLHKQRVRRLPSRRRQGGQQ